MKKKNAGFNLIELIIFIVVTSILIGLFTLFYFLFKNTHLLNEQVRVAELAEQRMELIVKQKNVAGFVIVDPCKATPPPGECNLTALGTNYSIDSNITDFVVNGTANPNLKQIVVVASKTGQGVSVKLTSLLTNY